MVDIDSINCYSENYLCDMCDSEFMESFKLVSHSINKHEIPEDQISYDCANCYQSFSILSKFKQHIAKKDNSDLENESNKGEINKNIEEDVETNHTDQYYSSEEESINDFGHECHECNTIFPFESYLKKHIIAVHNKNTQNNEIYHYLLQRQEKLPEIFYKGKQSCSKATKKLELVPKLILKDVLKTDAGKEWQRNNKQFKNISSFLPRFYLSEVDKGVESKIKMPIKIEDIPEKTNLNEKNSIKKDLKNNLKEYKCDTCVKYFSHTSNLKQHIHIIHKGNKDYQCESCGKSFSQGGHLKRHIHRVHEGHKDYKCDSCGTSFSSGEYLKKHIHIIHEGHKDYKCEPCGKSFSSTSSLKVHMMVVHNKGIKKQYKCDLCNLSFKGYTTLKYHTNKNHDGEKFFCDYCDRIFFTKKQLVTHIKAVHANIKNYVCHLCEKQFGAKYSLDIHLQSSIHVGTQNIQCESCGRNFTHQRNLNYHIKYIHSGKEKNHHCNFCSRKYRSPSDLRKHIKHIHENPRKKGGSKQCDSCGKVFKHHHLMKNHIEIAHEGLKKYSCNSCDKKYASNDSLQRHINFIHKGIKKYKCESCDKTFAKKLSLINHQDSIHNGIVQHICELCDKSFYSKHNKKFHIDTVHKRLKNYKCQLCEKSFTANPFLRYHTDKVHKGQESN